MHSANRNGGIMSPATAQTRELAARESDGIYVVLLWHPDEGAVTVSVEDARAGDHLQIAVAPARALDAFYHPFAIGGAVGTKTVDPYTAGPGESGRMDRILNDGFKQPAGENVVIQSRSLRAGDPAFDPAVADVVARVSKVAVVQNVHRGQISKDKHTALVKFEIRGDKNKAGDKVGSVLDRVDDAQRAHPGFFIGEFGDASAQKAVDQAAANDLESAGVFSIPITLIILVVAFGALVAAGIPLLLALTAVFATLGLVALPSQLLPIAQEVPATVLLIGLAVGVDYSMFYLRREREERAAGRSERAALEAAAATSGRSVLISGLTVITAMAGVFLTGEGRIWGRIVSAVLRRPVLSASLAGGLLVALAVPALQLRLVTPGPDTFPQHLAVVQTYNRMQHEFPGRALPANVIVRASNVRTPAVQAAI